MKKFIFNSLFIFLTIVFGYVVISFSVNNSQEGGSDFMAAIIDKHDRAQSITGPKMILAGGSNFAFGINSKSISDDFSVPVINMGLHAGLGLEFIINELKAVIKKGDIVILSIEYLLGKEGDYNLKRLTKKLYPEADGYYDENIIKGIKGHINKTRKNLKSIYELNTGASPSIYSRKGFNEFGDVVCHLSLPLPKKLRDRGVISYRYWEGIDHLNCFYKYAKSKEVNVFFVFPSYPRSEYVINKKVLNKLENDVLEGLLIDVLGTAQDFIFDDNKFFDTVYPLNKDGRKWRTNKLIDLLKTSFSATLCIKKITR